MYRFRADIEGLRAVAILLVIAYHTAIPGWRGGFVGVDVFFVISGFLITGLITTEIEDTGRLRFAEFYARRARRLLPALSLVVAATMAAGLLILAPPEQLATSATALTTSLYASNVQFAAAATNYLGRGFHTDPLLHTWSLAVEEQFYLGWPLLVAAGFGAGARRRRLAAVMLATLAASLGLSIAVTSSWQPYAFFLSPTRAWEFALGGLGALLPVAAGNGTPTRPGDRARPFAANVAAWSGLAAIVVAAMAFGRGTPFPGVAALLPAAGAALVLVAGSLHATGPVQRALSWTPFQYLGRLSYGWYLWHWPVLVLAAAVAGPLGGGTRALLMIGALALADVSYRLLENPVRRSPALAGRPARSLGLAVALAGAGVLAATGWKAFAAAAMTTELQRTFAAAARDLPVIDTDGCAVGIHAEASPPCEYGAAGSSATIVLFGDSHAAHWFPAVEAVAREQQARLVVLVKASCSFVSASKQLEVLGRVYRECDAWRVAALQRIRALAPRTIILATSDKHPLSPDDWRAGLSRTLGALAGTRRIVLLRDTPHADFHVPSCLAGVAWRRDAVGDHACGFPATDAQSDSVFALQVEAIRPFANTHMLDVNGHICPAATCYPWSGGIARYRDGNHLTATYARSLAPLLTMALDIGTPEPQR